MHLVATHLLVIVQCPIEELVATECDNGAIIQPVNLFRFGCKGLRDESRI